MNLASLADRHEASAPSVYDGADWLSWGTVRRRARALAGALRAAGVQAGDRVALLWPNSADFVIAYLGVLAAGAVAVPLNPSSPDAELAGELGVVRPTAVLGGGAGLAAVEAVRSAGSVRVCADDGPDGSWHQWSDGGGEGADDTVAAVERAPGDLAVLLFTSGTAGPPKAAMLTHGNLAANLDQMLSVPGGIIRPDDVALAVVPMFHVFGLNVVVGLALAAGAALVPMERFEADTAVATVARHHVTVLVGAPPMFQALAGVDRETDALSTVRLAVSGAAALPDGVVSSFEARYGITLDQGYGLTEASPVVSTTVGSPRPAGAAAGRQPGSLVGQVLPGIELRLVDLGGEDVLARDPGEIWVRGDNVFAGYWDDLEASVQVLTDDRWLKTGDVGVLDADGFLHVVERHKDVIIVSGFNVFPAEVERVIATVDGVEDVVVLGRPDPATGEAVEAVVVRAEGRVVTDDAVRSRCRARLASYKCPTTVRFVDALPRGLTGKALRRALREQAA